MGLLKYLWQSVAGVPPKYKFTDDIIVFEGETLRRIRALRRIELTINGHRLVVNPGDLGGYIAFDPNHPTEYFHLSQRDNSWVGGNAKCCGLSKIGDESLLSGNAVLRSAKIYQSFVGGEARITCAKVYYSYVYGNATLRFYSDVLVSCSSIFGNARVEGNAGISHSCIYDNTSIIVTGPYTQIKKIDISFARIFGDTKITYPIDGRDGHGGGVYKNKNVSDCVIDSVDAYNAACRSGKIRDLGREGCKFVSPHGYETIDRIFPLGTQFNIPVSL